MLREWDGQLLADLHQHYGIDMCEPSFLQRPWWWFRSHVLGLFDIPEARLSRWAMEAMK